MSSNVYQNILDMWNKLEPPSGDMVWACLTPEAEQDMLRAIQGAKGGPRFGGSGKATLLGYRNGELAEI